MKNPDVDAFLRGVPAWREEMTALREIALDSGLTEEVKWGQPCYTDEGRNIVIIHGFKEYCAMLFVKGALLKDAKGILIRQTENVQEARQARFTELAQVTKLEKTLKAYIKEAIANEKAGLKVEKKKTSDYPVPAELKSRLDADSALKTAFEGLTPGRQRAYLYYIAQAKQAATREARVEKCAPKILEGLGLDD